MADKGWRQDRDSLREAFGNQLGRMAREIGETLGKEASYAVTDIRQKLVEEGWTGKRQTPPFREHHHHQHEQPQASGQNIHGNGPGADRQPDVDGMHQGSYAEYAERKHGIDIHGNGEGREQDRDRSHSQERDIDL